VWWRWWGCEEVKQQEVKVKTTKEEEEEEEGAPLKTVRLSSKFLNGANERISKNYHILFNSYVLKSIYELLIHT
jgi:hypothetical protein